MDEKQNYCRVCLKTKQTNISLYQQVQQIYLPSLIENICGLVISNYVEPKALICRCCTEAIIKANDIIQKCRKSHETLLQQNLIPMKQNNSFIGPADKVLSTLELKTETDLDLGAEKLTEPILENCLLKPLNKEIKKTLADSTNDEPSNIESKETKHKQPTQFKIVETKSLKTVISLDDDAEKPSEPLFENCWLELLDNERKTSLTENTDKTSHIKIQETRSKNSRKYKTIDTKLLKKLNPFYFRCHLCSEFESNYPTNSKSHLITVHGIERPAVFYCSQCNHEPYLSQASVQRHFASNHLNENKKQNFKKPLEDKITASKLDFLPKVLKEAEVKIKSVLDEGSLADYATEDTLSTKKEKSQEKKLYKKRAIKPKAEKAYVRDPEIYVNRKIRNNTMREPLKLIGDPGVIVRKRKFKSHYRAIPNFNFSCKLCKAFETNVALFAKNHLKVLHNIEKPAIFYCSECDIKPFKLNQSLYNHIAFVHRNEPRKRVLCQQCGKFFNKDSHLKRHLLDIHKNKAQNTGS